MDFSIVILPPLHPQWVLLSSNVSWKTSEHVCVAESVAFIYWLSKAKMFVVEDVPPPNRIFLCLWPFRCFSFDCEVTHVRTVKLRLRFVCCVAVVVLKKKLFGVTSKQAFSFKRVPKSHGHSSALCLLRINPSNQQRKWVTERYRHDRRSKEWNHQNCWKSWEIIGSHSGDGRT